MLTQIAAYQQMISINLQTILAAKWKQVTNHAWAQPSTSELSKIWYDILKLSEMSIKVHLTPKFFSAKIKLCNIHIQNLIISSVSGSFKRFKNWQKGAEICNQLVHDRASRGLTLFLIWRHRLIYMALTLYEHACKTGFDVKPGIDLCPSPARSWEKAYQISGCTVARKKFRRCEKKLSCFWNSFKFAFLRK